MGLFVFGLLVPNVTISYKVGPNPIMYGANVVCGT